MPHWGPKVWQMTPKASGRQMRKTAFNMEAVAIYPHSGKTKMLGADGKLYGKSK